MPTTPPYQIWLTRLARVTAWLALTIGLCLGLGWAALHVWIVPRIADFRPALEQLASRTMGMPVRVGELRAESTGWVPSFELREIRLLDTEGRPALTLPRVVLAISVRSLLRLGLEQLVLDQPELDVRHTTSGQWLVAGLALGTPGSENSAVADWLFSQREVVVRGGSVRWTSEQAAGTELAPSLTLTNVDIVVHNALRRHDLRLDATPAADLGERFVLMGRFQRGLLSTHPGRFTDWSGEAFAHFPRADVAQLRQHMRLGIDLHSGQGRLRLWSDIQHGRWVGATADLDLQQVQLRLGEALEPLRFAALSGRLTGQHDALGWSLSTRQLAFRSDEGLDWRGGDIALRQQAAQGQRPERYEVQGQRMDLQTLRELAIRLPLPAQWQQRLREHMFSGEVQSMQLRWDGPPEAPRQWQGQVSAERLHMQALPGAHDPWPGLQGGRLVTQFGPEGGKLQLHIDDGGAISWPGILEEDTLAVRRLHAEGRWQRQAQGWSVPQWKVQLANEDLQGQAQGQWQSAPQGGPGILDMQAQIGQMRAERVYRYLPTRLPAQVRRYVRESVQKGQVQQLQVRIKGDLAKLPMRQARDGEFRFAARLNNVEMAYVPSHLLASTSAPWPALQNLQGDLVFERQGMKLLGASAHIGDARNPIQVTQLRAEIADLTHDATLELSGELKGTASQVLRTLQQSPVDALLSGALNQAQASGVLQGKLRLQVPVLHSQDTKVQGSVTFNGNDVQVSPHVPPLEKAQGTLTYTESSFQLQGIQARLLGGNSRLDGGLRSTVQADNEPRLLIRAQGQVSADGLRAARPPQALDVLARQAKGQTSYTANLGWRNGQPELQVRSNLEGLELNLPTPLGKRASQPMPLFIGSRVLGSLSPAQRDQVQIELGQVVNAVYVRDLSGPSPRAVRGSLALGQGINAPALPEQGVEGTMRLDDLSLDAWQALWPTSLSSAALALGEDTETTWMSYLPNRLGLQATQLNADGRTLHDVVASITREGSNWHAKLDARELSGHAQYTPASRQQGARLFARLARLNLPPAAVNDVESMLETPPGAMPTLDIQIDDLVLRGKHLGKVEVEASTQDSRAPRTGASGGREWVLNKFNVTVPEASLRAQGRWAAGADNQPRRTEMRFRLDVQDSGALLSRLGTPGALRAGAGHLEGQIGWNGSPLAMHFPSMQGQFHIGIGRGQFLKSEPGVAKLLGVLSLQALPRRLLLDFRDVFAEGFVFDTVQGDVQIQQGIASTHNLHIQGVNAIVRMEGSADIAKETQQLKVLILPQLDAGGASVVAGLAVNPAVGLTAFLTQWLLKIPLSKVTVQQFAIDGSWSDPRVTRVGLSDTPTAQQP